MVDTNLQGGNGSELGTTSVSSTLETSGPSRTPVTLSEVSSLARANMLPVFYYIDNKEHNGLIEWTDDYETALIAAKRSLQHRLSKNSVDFKWRRWLETRIQTSSGDKWAEFAPESFANIVQAPLVELRLCEERLSTVNITVLPIGYEPTFAPGDAYYQLKVITVGSMSVGKTMMLQCFTTPKEQHLETLQQTTGVRISTVNRYFSAQGKYIKVSLWDTVGQERYRAVTRSHYRNASGVLLVYDTTDHGTFNDCSEWLSDIRREVEEHIPVMLVGNKVDRVEERTVELEEAQNFANEHGLLFLEASSTEGTNVVKAFQTLLYRIFNQLSDRGELHEFTKKKPVPAPPPAPRRKCW